MLQIEIENDQKTMKIQHKQTTEIIDYTNEQTLNKNSTFDVEPNLIRDKLRKKKHIVKKSGRQTKKQCITSKKKRNQGFCGKKIRNSIQSSASSKPLIKIDQMDLQSCQKTADSHEMLLNFFQNQLPQYFTKCSVPVKSNAKSSKKILDLSSEKLIEHYLHELNNQNEIKVMTLLQQKEKLIFKSSNQQNMHKYEQQAMDFLLSIRKKQQKQNYDHNRQQKLQQQLSLILQSTEILSNNIFYLNSSTEINRDDLCEDVQKISLLEKLYLIESKAFEKVWEKDISSKINESQQMKQLAQMLLVLTKCYKNNHNRVNQLLQKIQSTQQKTIAVEKFNNIPSQVSNNNQFYIKCLIKKSLIKSFSEQQTLFSSDHQIWNHFKLASHLQQNIINEGYRDHQKYTAIESQDQYKQYMKRIKNKKIIYKPALHTNCKACFSNHFQRFNPIVKCPQCKARMHKLCGKLEERCDKCNYKKLGANLKAQTPKCFICQNDTNSLMLHKLKGTKFVHNFCMLVHNLWAIVDEKIIFDLNKKEEIENEESTKSLEAIKTSDSVQSSQKCERKPRKSTSIVIQQEEEKECESKKMIDKSEQLLEDHADVSSKNVCKFCKKGSQCQKLYLNQCKNCNQSFHILCAYLNGCSIQISEWKNNFQISLSISCCSSSTQTSQNFQERIKQLQMSRKYKLNYQKFALNYGFENEPKTSKHIQSYCSLQQVQQEQEKHEQKQTDKCAQSNLLFSMKDQQLEEC